MTTGRYQVGSGSDKQVNLVEEAVVAHGANESVEGGGVREAVVRSGERHSTVGEGNGGGSAGCDGAPYWTFEITGGPPVDDWMFSGT